MKGPSDDWIIGEPASRRAKRLRLCDSEGQMFLLPAGRAAYVFPAEPHAHTAAYHPLDNFLSEGP